MLPICWTMHGFIVFVGLGTTTKPTHVVYSEVLELLFRFVLVTPADDFERKHALTSQATAIEENAQRQAFYETQSSKAWSSEMKKGFLGVRMSKEII